MRLLALMMFLQTRGRVTLDELREQFKEYREPSKDAGRRKFERDKDELGRLGVRIRHLGHLEDHAYEIDARGTFLTTPVQLDDAERALLGALAREASESPSQPYSTALQVALDKLGVSPTRATDVMIRHPLRDSTVTQAMLDSLMEALRRRKTIRFEYGGCGADFERQINPYGLFLRLGRWYVCGLCRREGDVRVFRLSRLSELQVNSRAPGTPDFPMPDDFDLAEHAALDPLGFKYHPSTTVEVRVDPDISHLAKAAFGPATPDDPELFRFETTNSEHVIELVLDLGSRATIIGPSRLRRAMRNHLLAVIEAHTSP